MLHLYKARNLQALADQYIQLAPSLPTQLFAKQPVITSNKMIGRWLQQQLAQKDGISVNLEPVLPAKYSWRLIRQVVKDLPDTSDFSAEVMQFKLLSLLDDPNFTGEFPRLHNYLKGCTDANRMVLATKVSRIFDLYQVYRGDWLSAWEQGESLNLGEDEGWQRTLWQSLTSHSSEKYRSQLEQQLISAIEGQTFTLPKSLCVFGVANLPASFIDIVKALAKHCECHVFAFSAKEDKHIPAEVAHWHQTGIDFFSQLNTNADFETSAPPANTQLQRLQSSLAGNSIDATKVDANKVDGNDVDNSNAVDKSLLTVNCFSEMREVEALHDFLLNQFGNETGMKPGDVLVAMPDLDKYAPFIRAVFDASSETNTNVSKIPYVINASLAAAESPLINGLIEILEIPGWRFTREQVLVLGRNRLIQKRFNFTDEALDQIDNWLDEAGVRWGIDAAHRQELGLPAMAENTWRAGLDRLLLGAVLPKKIHADLPLFHNVLPVDEIEGGLTLLLSQFVSFCELLFDWCDVLKQAHNIEEWQLLLQKLLDDFFIIDELEERNHLELLELFDQLKQQTQQIGFEETLSSKALLVLLNERISGTPRSGRLGGMVNFSNMNALAGIPFKQVCLLGLNYDTWPTQQREPGFDLLQNQNIDCQRPGDRNKVNDERYVTLQLILSAQQSLYISYVGRNIHNGEEVPPSVLVSELLDCCEQISLPMPKSQHAMHIYSAGNFQTATALQSHDEKWLQVAKHIGRGKRQAAPLFEQALKDIEPVTHIEIDELCRFFQNPQNSFLRSSLGIYIRDETSDWQNVEPFSLENFADSSIRSIALGQARVGRPNTSMAMARASGQLPHGIHGDILQSIEQETVDELLEDVEPEFLLETQAPIVVDLKIEGINISGVLRDLRPEGQLLLISDNLYPWQRIQLWLKHLVLCCVKPEGIQCVTKVMNIGGTIVFNQVGAPEALLAKWVKAYCDGQAAPLAFFAKVSWEYASSFARTGNEEKALKSAFGKWLDGYQRPGECSKPANEFLYRGHSPLDNQFEANAKELLCPLIQAGGQ